MSKFSGIRTISVSAVLIVTSACFISQVRSANAPLPREARVTQVIQDVKLLPANRPAAINDDVREGMAVRTGLDSRTELTFGDLTITRLGANSVFSFNAAERTFDLGQGAILMSVPPNAPSVKVKTAAVTAAISGGTAIAGAGPPFKLMVLEGIAKVYPTGHPELAITLKGGEMVTLVDGKLVKQEFSVRLVLETSELTQPPFDVLPNYALIWEVVFEQEGNEYQYVKQYDDIDDRDQSSAASQGAPAGPPGKFGTPSTIGSPIPYQINSGTEIQTDPTITTNGVTDQGKIYRDPVQDGPLATWAFGSTTSFDIASSFFQSGALFNNVAVFKFQSLELDGNPIITVGPDAPTQLGLIGIDGITSGNPGGSITFTGMDFVFLATQNGPINLGSTISFDNIGQLWMYARGSNGNLTLGSAVNGVTTLNLNAEGTVQVNADVTVDNFNSFVGSDFLVGSGFVTAINLNIQSLGDINLDSEQFPEPFEEGLGGQVILTAADTLNIFNFGGGTFGWDVLIAAGETINLMPSDGPATFDFSDSSSVLFEAGTGGINAPDIDFVGRNLTMTSLGNIDIRSLFLDDATQTVTVTAGNLLTVGGPFTISLDKSNLGDGGNIVVGSGSDFTADEVTLEIFASAPSGAGGNITVNVGGSMDTGAVSLLGSFATTNPQGPGENVTLQVTQDLTVSGGKNDAGISLIVITPVHQTLTSGANVTLDVGGNLMTDTFGGVNLFINNNINEVVTGSNITATIGGTLTTDYVSAVISNESGEIGTGGNITFQVGGALTAGDVNFQLFNRAGAIGNGGQVTLDVTGNLTTTGAATFVIQHINATNIPAETSIDVSAASITVGGSLDAYIDDSTSGNPMTGTTGSVDVVSDGVIAVTSRLNVLGNVTADGNISGGTISSTNVTSLTSIAAGDGGIQRFSTSGAPFPDVLHTLTAPSVSSSGGINFNGMNADGDFSPASDGGDLTINTDSLTFISGIFLNSVGTNGIALPGQILGSVTFNGGDASSVFGPGSGGTFTVNTNGPASTITVNSDIEATTGRIGEFDAPAGNGGTVTLNAGDTLTVNARIEVSSAEPTSSAAPSRRSAQGGNINLTSAKKSGVAINVTSSGQLLALLDQAATGPGGKITILASAPDNSTNSSSINIDNLNGDPGAIIADRGTVDIRHQGDSGQININNANIRGDIVKIGAFGDNGSLNIGGGTISADTILKLYAPGSNGELNFIANVTLSSGTVMDLAAKTITIQPTVVVNIIGDGGAANIYTDNPNYSPTSGGTNASNGTFGGNGANAPQPLASAPPFGP